MRINNERDRPVIQKPTDVILKVTSTTICGSDLHLYLNELQSGAMQKGDISGHEFMGIVDAIASEVHNVGQSTFSPTFLCS